MGRDQSWFNRLVEFFRRLPVDSLFLAVVGAIVAATVFPVQGDAEIAVNKVTSGAVAALLLLYGARLSRAELSHGLTRWRLHLLILASTFIVFPLVGLLVRAILPAELLPDHLSTGMLFVCLLPSTTLSSIALTAVARGSVADAVIGASVSNLLGMILTPLLVLVLMGSTGDVRVDGTIVYDLTLQLLLPFVVGQLLRTWLQPWIAAHAKQVKVLERAALALVVYSAFTEGVDDHVWESVSVQHMVTVLGVCTGLYGVMLAMTASVGRVISMPTAQRTVLEFCGVQKSIAVGLPMALIIFAGLRIGLVALPLIIYYLIQILAGSVLAARKGRRDLTSASGGTETSGGAESRGNVAV